MASWYSVIVHPPLPFSHKAFCIVWTPAGNYCVIGYHQLYHPHYYHARRTRVFVLHCSTEQMFDDLDEETQQKILPLRTVNQKATEFIDGRVVLNKAGTRRLDDMESK